MLNPHIRAYCEALKTIFGGSAMLTSQVMKYRLIAKPAG